MLKVVAGIKRKKKRQKKVTELVANRRVKNSGKDDRKMLSAAGKVFTRRKNRRGARD